MPERGGCQGEVPGGSGPGGGIPASTEEDPPPINRMTDGCKNITLATIVAGKNIMKKAMK